MNRFGMGTLPMLHAKSIATVAVRFSRAPVCYAVLGCARHIAPLGLTVRTEPQ
jgi:hypothetical protein